MLGIPGVADVPGCGLSREEWAQRTDAGSEDVLLKRDAGEL